MKQNKNNLWSSGKLDCCVLKSVVKYVDKAGLHGGSCLKQIAFTLRQFIKIPQIFFFFND